MTVNKYKTTRRRSSMSEAQCATELGGVVQPNSGATPFSSKKGDVRTKFFVVDDKVTDAESYRLTVDDLRKIRSQAFKQQRQGIMRINFAKSDVAVYVVPASLVIEYQELKAAKGKQ